MVMIETIAVVISFLTLAGAVFAVYNNINIKLKELEVKIINMENKFNDIKEERIETFKMFEKNIEKIWDKLDTIESKLDQKFQELAVIKSEHERSVCNADEIKKK